MAIRCYLGKFKFNRVFYTDTGHARSEMLGLLQLKERKLEI